MHFETYDHIHKDIVKNMKPSDAYANADKQKQRHEMEGKM